VFAFGLDHGGRPHSPQQFRCLAGHHFLAHSARDKGGQHGMESYNRMLWMSGFG
jgi:hypothetical protein